MATQTSVNGQITDLVTQTNTKVLGRSHFYTRSKVNLAVHQALATAIPTAVNGQITDLTKRRRAKR